MDWQEQLDFFMSKKNWKNVTKSVQKIIDNDNEKVDIYISIIYSLLHILLEEKYTDNEHNEIAQLLKKIFNSSYRLFFNNPDYLFFVGSFMLLAEWYFGESDNLLALKMIKKAFKLKSNNLLYSWGWKFANNNALAKQIAKQIFEHHTMIIEGLKSKGAFGNYVINSLRYSISPPFDLDTI